MNNKKNYKKGVRKEILDLILSCGVISYKSLPFISYIYSRSWFQIRLNDLKKEDILIIESVTGIGRIAYLKNYTQLKREIENYTDSKLYDYYELNYYQDLKKRENREYISRIRKTVRTSEIKILLRLLQIKDFYDCTGITPSDIGFLTSKQIKSITEYKDKLVERDDGSTSLNISRIIGMVKTENEYFPIYNGGNEISEWMRSSEGKIAIHLTKIASMIEGRQFKVIKAIYFVYDYESVNMILESDKRIVSINNIEDAYDHIYCLPYTRDGFHLLQIILQKNWKKVMKKILIEEIDPNSSTDVRGINAECDGYDRESGIYTFLICDPDICRIRKMFNFINTLKNKKKCRLICFDFQKEMVLKNVSNNATILTFSIDDYIDEIGLKKFSEKNKNKEE